MTSLGAKAGCRFPQTPIGFEIEIAIAIEIGI